VARTTYWLTPPTRLTFIVSVILVILALLVRYAHVSIPFVNAHVFETLLIVNWCCSSAICFAGFKDPDHTRIRVVLS